MAAGSSPQQARVEALELLAGANRGEAQAQSEPDEREIGIAGARVCQACGTIESFSGLPAAMLKHRKGDYLCVPCLRQLSGAASGPYSTRELEHVEAAMARRERRFCEGCATELPSKQSSSPSAGPRLCADCRTSLEELDQDFDKAMWELSRRRFVRLLALGGG